MYHSVSDDASKLTVRPEVFERQMRFLSTSRAPVSMESVVNLVSGKGRVPKNAVHVSIDDGYLDTYTEAFPILQKYKIPFTLFLTTDLRSLEKLKNLPRPTWEQLRSMLASGLMEIGLHGHTHADVRTIAGDRASLDQELRESVFLVERELGVRPRAYAYAFGARDARIPPYLREIGIPLCFSITDGLIYANSPTEALRRVQIDSTMGFGLFRLRTTGAVDVAFRLKRNLGRLAYWRRGRH
jgi:peptidoglycan/xylan/chitin deacetylase (PgdA/CDA1 family)